MSEQLDDAYVVAGFEFSGIAAGIKQNKKLDLCLITSNPPAQVVGSFTTNLVQAAPVLVSKKNIRSGLCSAVITNSGNANACTGAQGLRDARAMVQKTARTLKVAEKQVLVCSTGKIGIPLPIKQILKKIPEAVDQLSSSHFLRSAEAILTTDQSIKIARAEGKIGGVSYRIAGFAKGAGMIEPHMEMAGKHATMLAYILTDIAIPRSLLKSLFGETIQNTFNRISVDGDTSTNDTALMLANGCAQNRPFARQSPEGRQFAKNLFIVMESLAKQMVIDGEGATKCVKIDICGAKNNTEARKLAYTIANSPLVRTSFFGKDPNWGRVLGAAGRAGVALNPDKVDIFYGPVCIARRGTSTGIAKDRAAKEVMQSQEFTVRVDCHLGKGFFSVYTSDLTLDYVKINSCYRT